MKPIFFSLILTVSVFAVSAYAETENIDKLTSEAVSSNIGISAAKQDISASKAREVYKGSLNDPMVSLGYINEGFDKFTIGKVDYPMSRFAFMVSQMFPYPGKLAQKVIAEQYGTKSAEDKVKETELITAENVRSNYLDLYTVQESRKLLNSKINFLQMLESASAARYKSGTGASGEVLMIQAEKYMVSEDLEMLKEKERMLKASLAHLTNRDSDKFGDFVQLPDTKLKYSQDELYDMSVDGSYALKGAKEDIGAMDADVKMKELEKYPDFTVNAGYEPRFSAMPDVWSLSVSFNVPLYYKKSQLPAIDEAKAKKLRAETDYANMRHELKSTITTLVASVDSSDRIMTLYKAGVIAKSNQARDAALAAYRTGTMGVTDVISSVNNAIDYEIKYLGKYSEKQKSISTLNTLTGGRIYGDENK